MKVHRITMIVDGDHLSVDSICEVLEHCHGPAGPTVLGTETRDVARLPLNSMAAAAEAAGRLFMPPYPEGYLNAAKIEGLEAELEELRCGDLVPYQSGELTDARAEKFRCHLARCEACQHSLQDLVAMDAGLAEAGAARQPEAAIRLGSVTLPDGGAIDLVLTEAEIAIVGNVSRLPVLAAGMLAAALQNAAAVAGQRAAKRRGQSAESALEQAAPAPEPAHSTTEET